VSTIRIAHIPWTREPAPGLAQTWITAAIAEAVAAVGWLRRARCGIGGHTMMLQFEPHRLSMRCHSCGEETPGWAIAE
jgi:hypothetical protein